MSNEKQTVEMEEKENIQNPNEHSGEEVKATQNTAEKESVPSLEEQIKNEKDQYLRLFAEFENFRKRTAKERIELMATSTRELMSALLPVIDDFERALNNIEDEETKKGVSLIHEKLMNTLKSKGLSASESTINQTFDVDTMEAITHIPAQDPSQDNIVVDEVEKGYKLNDRIIRYAKVVVAKKQ